MKNKIYNKINKKIESECDKNEYCPIYLSYLGKYGENSEEIKYCKNPTVHYCKKYNLVDKTAWNNMTKEEKINLIKDIGLINFIDKNRT